MKCVRLTLPLRTFKGGKKRKFYVFSGIKLNLHWKQVALLWQRDRTKLDTFSINVQRYSQNHKIAFFGHPVGASWAIQVLYMKVLMQRNFVAVVHRKNASFTRKTTSSRFWATLCEVLRGNVCDSSLARWKYRGQLPIGYNWTLFASSYDWGTNASKSAFVEGGGSLWG